jgi:hypothetical protein
LTDFSWRAALIDYLTESLALIDRRDALGTAARKRMLHALGR